MAELKLYVTMSVPDDFFDDENYDQNMQDIHQGLQHTADLICGDIDDVEIK